MSRSRKPTMKKAAGKRADRTKRTGKLGKDQKTVHAAICGDRSIHLIYGNKKMPDHQLFVLSVQCPQSMSEDDLLYFLEIGMNLEKKYQEHTRSQR